MSWMITNLDELEGTCYIEVLPGRFANKCWNPDAVFFKEEHFAFIERVVVRHCPKHDHYSFTDINRSIWHCILADLERLHSETIKATKFNDLKNHSWLPAMAGECRGSKSESEALQQICEMLNGFMRWVRDTLESHDVIAVLGM